MPVDLFGLPVDYERVNAIAAKHGLFVIEDAAQSFGATYHGRKAGSLGNIGCTSFFPAKPLGCYGDGGAVFTTDGDLAESVISMRIHGKGKDKYDNARIGLNARMDTLQAALLLPKLDIFPQEIVARNHVATRYTELLAPQPSLDTPHVPDGLQSAWAQYSILTDRRKEIQSALKEKGIPTAVYYPKPLHLQTAYARLGYGEGDFPSSEAAAGRIVSLPMHPYLEDRHLRLIATEIAAVLSG
jgi:UDP-2-acetamido-2-deoxy-ribo-hexuluronate aminotransferase